MKSLQLTLEELGLSHHESNIYLYILSQGECSASKVATATSIPRSTARGYLDQLCSIGLLGKVYRGNTQHYHCKNPKALRSLVEKKVLASQALKDNLQQLMPTLSSLFAEKGILPKVQFFEGKEQVIKAFDSTLYIEGLKEILVLTSYDFLEDPIMRKHDDSFYIPMRVKKGIFLKSIVGNTPLIDKLIKNEPDELRQRRFFPKGTQFPGTFYIYGDYVLYFAFHKKEYMAVIVESSTMAQTMKVLHTFMWEQCNI